MRLTLDRIEEGIAVCFDESGTKYEIACEHLDGALEGDLFETEINGDEIKVIRILREETEMKKASNADRLKNLFNRRKDK